VLLNDETRSARHQVSQELPFPGKLGLASEQAKREAESEQQNYGSVVLGVTARLKVAWYEWLAVQKAIELTREGRDLLSRFEEIARNRYTVGKGLQQDVLKAQFEVSAVEQQFAMLDEKWQRAEAEIASLLAVPTVALRPPGEIQQPDALRGNVLNQKLECASGIRFNQ
jgi:cobalt-zinc-cadmium efflux system outer membrane protein